MLRSPVEWRHLNTDKRKFKSSQKDESRAQSADSSKARLGNLRPVQTFNIPRIRISVIQVRT